MWEGNRLQEDMPSALVAITSFHLHHVAGKHFIFGIIWILCIFFLILNISRMGEGNYLMLMNQVSIGTPQYPTNMSTMFRMPSFKECACFCSIARINSTWQLRVWTWSKYWGYNGFCYIWRSWPTGEIRPHSCYWDKLVEETLKTVKSILVKTAFSSPSYG